MTSVDVPTSRLGCLSPRRLRVTGDPPEFRRVAGVVMFADIAGFTAMTETARRREGARGIEQLTVRLNSIFAELVTTVHAAGGDVLKFGGDALLVAFDREGEPCPQTVRRAVWCADRLHRIIKGQRRKHAGRLSLHVGLAAGEWTEIVVGRPGQRREHFVNGEGISQAMHAAAAAAPGTCNLRGLASDWPGDTPAMRSWQRRGEWRLILPRQTWENDVPVVPQADTSANDVLADFVAPQLRAQLAQPDFAPLSFGEHRRVSTLFAFWHPPTGESRRAGLSLWHDVFRAVDEVTEATGGLWARSDPGGGYQKILILFGAPTSADDDVDRALECAGLLRKRFRFLGRSHRRLRVGLGLTTATVFSGYVGGPDRFEFTVMGDGVNLAARLAASAPKGIVLTDRSTRLAAGRWRFTPGPELKLKGVRGPVATFQLSGRIDTDATRVDELVEHPAALDSGLRIWERTRDGPIRIEVCSPADGRRFVSQFVRRLDLADHAVARFRFLPDDGAHPHGGLRRFLLWRAGVDNGEGLRAQLAANGREQTWHHLAPIYGPEQQLAEVLSHAGIDAWVERTATLTASTGLLAVADDGPTVIVLEQTECLSDIDRRVFERLASLPVNRPRFIMVHQSAGGRADDETILLGPVSKRELQSYIEQLMPAGAPSAQLLDWLYERSGGMARIARLYVEHLQNNGLLVSKRGRRRLWYLSCVREAALPDVLRAHHLQSIDHLPHSAGMVARALAVLGDGTPIEALEFLCRSFMALQAIRMAVETLRTEGITEQGDGVSFADPSVRRAVYETISFAVRERWHRRAAQYWRSRGVHGSVAAAEHLFAARDPSCLPGLEKAAQRAHRLWLLDRSRHLYRWALLAASGRCDPEYAKALPPLSHDLDDRLRRLLKPFAEVLQLQGLYPEARRVYQRLALDAARRHRRADQGENLLAVARIEWFSGRYRQALRQTSRVLHVAAASRTRRLAAQAHFLIGETARRTGGMRRAQQALEHAAHLFEQVQDGGAYADALNALGLVHWNCGRLDVAQQCFLNALRASGRSSQTGDPAKRGQMANNLGILMEERGRLHAAERYYCRAFDVFTRLGHRRNRGYSLGNLANLYRHGARYEHARAAYDEVELELLSIGERHAAAYTAGNRGDLARDFGDWTGALVLYQRALHFASHVGDADLIAESYCRLAEIQLAKRGDGEVIRLLRRASRAAEKAHSREFAIRVRLLKAELNLARGRDAVAMAGFTESERDAADAGLLLYLLWAWYGLGRCLLNEGRMKEAMRTVHRGLKNAHGSGYRWWELRFAVLGAQIESGRTTSGDVSIAGRENMHERMAALTAAIEATIGDPAVRAAFARLPLIVSAAMLRPGNVFSMAAGET